MFSAFGLARLRLSADTMDTLVLTRRGLQFLINILLQKDREADPNAEGRLFFSLPVELRIVIMDLAIAPPHSHIPIQLPTVDLFGLGTSRDPSIPPANSSKSPIKALPSELIRDIIAESLPAKGSRIKCLCGTAPTKAADRKPKRNRVSELMTVCKFWKETVKLAVYQERFFELHIHQGGTGGVELLDAGYQPLAYMETGSDDRFVKFTTADEYGFQHLKKIHISALCRLLERGAEEKDRLVNITITFPRGESNIHDTGRHNIMSNTHYWWDPNTHMPRTSSLHGLPDIELVLHPFARLTRVHNVSILLPTEIMKHPPTKKFVERLTTAMKSSSSLPTLLLSEDQENSISSMRQEVEDYIFSQKFGRSGQVVEKLGENELEAEDLSEGEDKFMDDFGDDELDLAGFSRKELKRAFKESRANINSKRPKMMLNDSEADKTSDGSDDSDLHFEMNLEERIVQTTLWESFSGNGHRLSNPESGSSLGVADIPLSGLLHRQRKGEAPTSTSVSHTYRSGMASARFSAVTWPTSGSQLPRRPMLLGAEASPALVPLKDGEIAESEQQAKPRHVQSGIFGPVPEDDDDLDDEMSMD